MQRTHEETARRGAKAASAEASRQRAKRRAKVSAPKPKPTINQLWRLGKDGAKRRFADMIGQRTVANLPNGAILYRGPSEIDGTPIVVVATGIVKASGNAKTDDLVQTWILRDTPDMTPMDHVMEGTDGAICGSCPYRANRGCYVDVSRAPRSIHLAVHRGRYPMLTPDQAGALFKGAAVRFGSYGDPAAVPLKVWYRLVAGAAMRAGYTHRWRELDPVRWGWLMASADTPQDRADSVARGWRYFTLSDAPIAGQVHCPSARTDGRIGCVTCGLCDGSRPATRSGRPVPSVFIPPHGIMADRARKALADRA